MRLWIHLGFALLVLQPTPKVFCINVILGGLISDILAVYQNIFMFIYIVNIQTQTLLYDIFPDL